MRRRQLICHSRSYSPIKGTLSSTPLTIFIAIYIPPTTAFPVHTGTYVCALWPLARSPTHILSAIDEREGLVGDSLITLITEKSEWSLQDSCKSTETLAVIFKKDLEKIIKWIISRLHMLPCHSLHGCDIIPLRKKKKLLKLSPYKIPKKKW